ncbi:response regulator [Chitinophagaceae bacterium LB-8]|uniref:Response regulator n=1 Tax=Paraflavisolibacter caeni TaxID=2982496 RepID=A0A9X2XXC4_9BACT|nr:response regulator [Paraflavisolibacter caeni]MCU7551036.1 response regulator [Paraflavisolibacter caeni]
MLNSGPIILIEDDTDDQELIGKAIREVGMSNEIIYLDNGADALQFLVTTTVQPFIILCDMNMPKMNGIELKMRIDENKELRKKSIPFVFFSTTANKMTVNLAYTKMTVQGFFEKSDQYKELVRTLKIIFDYWRESIHPNS